jgi:hypothetical protein
MLAGSYVEYIGGQDEIGKSWFPLERGIPYKVVIVGQAFFLDGGWKESIMIENSGYSFIKSMFKEITFSYTTSRCKPIQK